MDRDDPSVSVSKGCFVFKPSKKRKNERDPFLTAPWHQCFTTLWNGLEEKMQNVYDEVYSKVLKDLVNYVQHSHDSSPEMFANHNIIPAATLITGVNMPDHGLLFERLTSLLSGLTQHVAILHSRECNTVKATIEQMISQFMNKTNDINYDEESDDETTSSKLKKYQCNFIVLKSWYKEQLARSKTPIKCTLPFSDESNDMLKVRSPSKQRKLVDPPKSPRSHSKHDHKSPMKESTSRKKSIEVTTETLRKKLPLLIVIIPDFESFSAKVLQDFISIASSHGADLPIALVFGVATSVSALHRSLPYHVSSKLSIELFHSQKSCILLDHILEQVFLTADCPFHLGGRTFRLFEEVFMFYDFSVQGFVQSLKFCMMEHFYGHNVNRLCCPIENLDESIASLESKDLDQLRNIASFRKHIETHPDKEIIMKNNILLKKNIRKLVRCLHSHLYTFHVGLRILQVMTATLPNAPLDKQIRHMYASAITDWIHKSKEYKECFKLLGFQSREELLDKVSKVFEILNQAISTKSELSKPLVDMRDLLVPLQRNLQEVGMSQGAISPPKISRKINVSSPTKSSLRSPTKSSPMSPTKSAPRSPTKSPSKSPRKKNSFVDTMQKKVENRSDFYKNLAGKQEVQPLSAYEQVRQDLLDYFSLSLSSLLAPLSSLPLHELVLFDDTPAVKRHIIGAPRAAIHMALNNPHYYLQCDCCKLQTMTDITSSLPDICIVYKLHLECGKMINLYDWLQSFIAIVSPAKNVANGKPGDNDADDLEHREVDPEIQARFARAVAELQFLGFIKASKKKTDHVTRLTFNPK